MHISHYLAMVGVVTFLKLPFFGQIALLRDVVGPRYREHSGTRVRQAHQRGGVSWEATSKDLRSVTH
jgi:hypothetical protein